MEIRYIEVRVDFLGKMLNFFFYTSGDVTVSVVEFCPDESTYLFFDKYLYPDTGVCKYSENNWIEAKIKKILKSKELLENLEEYRKKKRLENRPTWIAFFKYWAKLAYKHHKQEEARKIVQFIRDSFKEKDNQNTWNRTNHVYMNRPEADILNVFKTILL